MTALEAPLAETSVRLAILVAWLIRTTSTIAAVVTPRAEPQRQRARGDRRILLEWFEKLRNARGFNVDDGDGGEERKGVRPVSHNASRREIGLESFN